MHRKTVAQIVQALDAGEFSCVELTDHYLKRIKQHNDTLNAVITLNEEEALAKAKAEDCARAAGTHATLSGIPILHKDIFCTQGLRTTCASRMLDNFVPPYESTVTQRCLENGMIPLGKTNMDEFAMGSSNETSYYDPCKNPWRTDAVPGGSSGGSAAAVAARLAPIATGTDTGGSIRQPASLCGITGLKPTYGRVSRWGMIAFASSLDQAGPMAQTCEDAALLMNTISGFDPKDSTSADKATPDFTAQLNEPLNGLTIGLPKQYFSNGLDPHIDKALQAAIDQLKTLGAQCVEIDLNTTDMAIPAYYVIAPAECSSNLSRFDGVRYGYRCDNPKDLKELYERSRAEGFGDEVKRRIMVGTYALSAGYYDAYYLKAQKIRRLIKQDFDQAFKQVDLILSPTTPTTAFKLGEKNLDPIEMYLNDIYTIAANLAGIPGLSIPIGFHEGLPIGMQLLGNHFSEERLLNVGHQFQQQSSWHLEIPNDYQG